MFMFMCDATGHNLSHDGLMVGGGRGRPLVAGANKHSAVTSLSELCHSLKQKAAQASGKGAGHTATSKCFTVSTAIVLRITAKYK